MKNVVCVIVIIGSLLIGSQSVAAETYTLGFLPFVGWMEYKVAEAKGFWENQGVNVTIIEYDVPTEFMRNIFQRRFDLLPTPQTSMTSFRNAGLSDTVYLGTLSIADHHKYVIIKNDLVNKSLKGQTIGIFNGDFSNTFLLSTYLNTVNTNLADVRLVEMSPDDLEANFRNNRLQVVLDVDRGNKFYEQADGVIAASTREFYEPHGLSILKEGGIAAIPKEDLKKILRGCIDAIEWIRDPANWEEYKALLKQNFFADRELSDDQIRMLIKEGKFFDPQTLLDHNQHLLREHFTQYRAFLAAGGSDLWSPVKADVLADFTYESVIKNQALIEVLQEYVQ